MKMIVHRNLVFLHLPKPWMGALRLVNNFSYGFVRRAGALSRSWVFKISPVPPICHSYWATHFSPARMSIMNPYSRITLAHSAQTLLQSPPAVSCQCWYRAAQPDLLLSSKRWTAQTPTATGIPDKDRCAKHQLCYHWDVSSTEILKTNTSSLCTMVTHHCVCIYSPQTASTSVHSPQDQSCFRSRSH